jgi:hypothetical protein
VVLKAGDATEPHLQQHQQQQQQQQASKRYEHSGGSSNQHPRVRSESPTLPAPKPQALTGPSGKARKPGAGTPGYGSSSQDNSDSSSSSIEAGIRHFTSGAGRPGDVLIANPVRRDQPGSTIPVAQQAGPGTSLPLETELDPYHLTLVPDSQAGPCFHVRVTYYAVTEVW